MPVKAGGDQSDASTDVEDEEADEEKGAQYGSIMISRDRKELKEDEKIKMKGKMKEEYEEIKMKGKGLKRERVWLGDLRKNS